VQLLSQGGPVVLDGQLQGVPTSWLVQLSMHVAAASAGVGATTDATAGSSRATPIPTRLSTLRRDVSPLGPDVPASSSSTPRAGPGPFEPPPLAPRDRTRRPGAHRCRRGSVGGAEDDGRGAVEAVRLVALEVVDDHFVRQVPHHEAGPARRWLHRFPLAPAPAREVRSSCWST
jgi:hypothetical protein